MDDAWVDDAIEDHPLCVCPNAPNYGDRECAELARFFLDDGTPKPAKVAELANVIAVAIEGWFEFGGGQSEVYEDEPEDGDDDYAGGAA
jgi:hypothetical protein